MAQEQQRQAMPPLKNVQYLNTPIGLTERDGDGVREINYIVGPREQLSFILSPEGQVDIARILIEELTNDEKRGLLDSLAPGIEVAQTVPQGAK